MKAPRWPVVAAFLAGLVCTGCPLPMGDANGQSTDDDVGKQLEELQSKITALETRLGQKLYGNGAAGERIVTSDIRLKGADANRQYTDFIVEPGVTLMVQSGTVIRCTGTFINRGTIILEHGTVGSDRDGGDPSTVLESLRPAAIGISKLAAASAEAGDATSDRVGGRGGEGLSEFESRILLLPRTQAGGAGGSALASGGGGGGALTVIAAGEIVNEGQIFADGEDAVAGGGGGGAGILVFASAVKVTNAAGAGIAAEGGNGGDVTADAAPGGGGGGGIVHLIAPEIDNQGTIIVRGGAAGFTTGGDMISAVVRSGGGGGGASAGAGGRGGNVPQGDSPAVPAEAGAEGDFITTLTDPAALF